ncbi:MAG: serine hydrolase domain-containing protein, partial [Candidatus Thorarchaeota archaeon]
QRAGIGLLVALIISSVIILSTSNISPSYSVTITTDTSVLPTESYFTAQDVDNRTDVQEFLNNYIARQLSEYHIRGAHLSVVKDGSIYFSNGYGHSVNGTEVKLVDANRTLFRVGSLSKAVTATAVLQLTEQGLIDLDADVNDYLEAFKIPDTFSEPIRIEHLLSHTAGFENTVMPVYLATYDNFPSLEETLMSEIPQRITSPGKVAMYSNFGYALLGYIVAQVSGMSFSDYVQSEIFTPLSMSNTYFDQMLPSEVLSEFTGGYSYSSYEGYIRTPNEYATLYPAAGLITTAEDYGRFLIAHLNNGLYNGNRILQSDTISLMHEVQFEAQPGMDGVCYGFYERNMNDLQMIGHGGITYWFHATEVMIPEENIGIYVCYNTNTAGSAGKELVEAFVDRYFPVSKDITPLDGHENRVERYLGEYINSHAYFSSAKKLEYLSTRYFDYLKVTGNQDGTIQVQRINSLDQQVTYDNSFIEVQSGFFLATSDDSKDILAFLEDEGGQITHLYFSWFPPEAWILATPLVLPMDTMPILEIIFIIGLVTLPMFMIIEIFSLRKYWKEEDTLGRAIRFIALAGVSTALITSLLGTSTLLPVGFALIILMGIAESLRFRLKQRDSNLLSLNRFAAATHYSLLLPGLADSANYPFMWRFSIMNPENPITWLEIQTSYHSLMSFTFTMMACYLIAVSVLALLVIFSWTKRGGLDLTSKTNVGERILYSLSMILSFIVVWNLSHWGIFSFIS